MAYSVQLTTKWADFDPNGHMRHTAYNDYAAECRVRLFDSQGLSLTELNKLRQGPVLFTENTNFKREVRIGEDLVVDVRLKACDKEGSRFRFFHRVFKTDGVLAAEIEVFGGWLDLDRRKLIEADQVIMEAIGRMEKTEDFVWIERNKK